MFRLRHALSVIWSDTGAIRSDLQMAFVASLAAGAIFAFIPLAIDALVDGYLLANPVLLPVASVLLPGTLAYALFAAVQQRSLHRIYLLLSAKKHSSLVANLLRLPLSAYRQQSSLTPEDLPGYVQTFVQQVSMPPVYLLITAGEFIGLVTLLQLWGTILQWVPLLMLAAVGFGIVEAYLYPVLQTQQRILGRTTLAILQHRPKFDTTAAAPVLDVRQQKYARWLSIDRTYTLIAGARHLCQAVFPLVVVITMLPQPPGVAFGLFWSAKKAAEITGVAVSWLLALNAKRDFFNLLNTAPESQEGAVIRLKGHIRVEHITFRYSPLATPVLDDISLEVHPGECVAVIGTSGAGKSTLLRLLMGIDHPDSGAIRYDDHNLASLNPSALRGQIGIVTQDSRLEPGSLLMNISAFTHIPIDRAWAAAKQANIDAVIRALASQMHTLVDQDGAIFSRGQVQRLLLARALVNDPTVLLLDEATSAIDDETQSAIFDNLRGMTRLIVTGRLSAARRADQIYLLHEGCIVESGSFEALIKQDGMFAELMRRQQP